MGTETLNQAMLIFENHHIVQTFISCNLNNFSSKCSKCKKKCLYYLNNVENKKITGVGKQSISKYVFRCLREKNNIYTSHDRLHCFLFLFFSRFHFFFPFLLLLCWSYLIKIRYICFWKTRNRAKKKTNISKIFSFFCNKTILSSSTFIGSRRK